MNISLKNLVIFCLVSATTVSNVTSTTTDTPTSTINAITVTTEDVTNTTTNTPTSTTNAITVTTEDVTSITTDAPVSTTNAITVTTEDVTSITTDAPISTTNAITVTTEAPGETSTGMLNTDTTTDSTDDTPVSTIPTTTATTTQDPCASSPCIGGSTCEGRFGGLFVCICRPGLFYLEMRGCTQTKVFPGRLSLNRTFSPDMINKMSEVFQQTASNIEEALSSILGNDKGYINSTVLSLSQGSVIADVQNFYDLSSSATSESVGNDIDDAISTGAIQDATKFTRGSMCDLDICDNTTTKACVEQEDQGTVGCTCKEGYIRSQFTPHSCRPCLNGEMAEGEDSCIKCSFGFAGFNCNDPYLLVVIVVSSVLGALLIIVIVALIVVSCRNQKGSSSSQVDYSSSYGNKKLHKPTGVSRIPRANPDTNKLEMTDSGNNQHYTDYDEDMSNRGRIPPPYRGRGVENGGVQNPYFRHDDDRMHRY